MKTVTTQEASEQFDAYARLAHEGERILDTRNGEPWVVLAPAPVGTGKQRGSNGLRWPDFAARLAPFYVEPVAGPAATELLARDKEDRF